MNAMKPKWNDRCIVIFPNYFITLAKLVQIKARFGFYVPVHVLSNQPEWVDLEVTLFTLIL